MLGTVPLGSVHAGLSPLSLLAGRARFDIWRRNGAADDLGGALTVGFGRMGIDDVTGAVPLGRTFAPLPLSSLVMEDVSAWFSGDRCGHAEGRVRARMAGTLHRESAVLGKSVSVSVELGGRRIIKKTK